MNTDVFTDPIKVGPGIWFSLHTSAIKATTIGSKESFILFVNSVCDNFKCMKCKPHFRKFIDTHNFKNYWNIKHKGHDIGFFKWTWELHNEVNKFLGKYQPSLEEAYLYYTSADMGVCFDCGGEEKGIPMSEDVPPILRLYKTGLVVPVPFKKK